MTKDAKSTSELPVVSVVAYSIGRLLILLSETPASAKQLAKMEGANPRTFQRYIQGLQAAGLKIEREGRKNKAFQKLETPEMKRPNDYLKIGEIIRVLHNRGGLTAKELSDLLSIEYEKIKIMLRELVKSGCLYAVKNKNENCYYHMILKKDNFSYTKCLSCDSDKIWKDGKDKKTNKQRYQCAKCKTKWSGEYLTLTEEN